MDTNPNEPIITPEVSGTTTTGDNITITPVADTPVESDSAAGEVSQ